MLAGCAGGHTHQTSDLWDADLTDHWKSCSDCSQATEKGAHTPDESDICTVCGAQIVDWGESKSLYQFTENGDPLKLADYDQEGTLLSETVYQYEYDEAGNMTHSVCTSDGIVTVENIYTVTDGESVLSQSVSYMEDGSQFTSSYDAYGNSIQLLYLNADGGVEEQVDSQYALSAEGEWYEAVSVTTEADGSKYICEFFENGDQTSIANYDAEGNLLNTCTWEYTYDEDGNWQTKKEYHNGILTIDMVYATVTTEDGSTTYPQTVTEYQEDGQKSVTVYDENDNVISQTYYNADGSVIS